MSGLGKSCVTADKQRDFAQIIDVYLRILKFILNKHGWAYHRIQYIDLYAGTGRYNLDGEITNGSPLLFLEAAARIGIRYDAYLFEKDIKSAETLRHYTKDFPNVFVIQGDNRETLPNLQLPPKCFGLLYADPNAACPQIPVLRELFKKPEYARIDLLLNIGFNGIKRAERVHCTKCELYEERGNLSRCFSNLKKFNSVKTKTRGIWGFTWTLYSNDSLMTKKFGNLGLRTGYDADLFLSKNLMTKEYIRDREECDECRYNEA